MTDATVTLNSGSGGEEIATDEISTENYQKIKLADGTLNSTTMIAGGGGVEAAALRVTVASDSTGVLSVDDNGGSLTVDNAALAVTGGGVEASALRVTIATDSTGVLSVDDNGGSLTVDGTVSVSNLAGTHVDDSAFTVGTDDGVPAFAMFDDTAPDSVDEGDAGIVRMSANRNLYSTIRDAAGNERGANVNASNQLEVAVGAALPAGTNNIGDVDIASALPAGTNNIGDVDVATIAAGSNLVGDVGISGARTSGGTTLYKNIDVDESEDQVKGTAGQVYWIHAINVNAALRYLKFYNATAASVTVGTTVPDLTFPVPAATTGAGFTISIPNGIEFDTAITIAATTGVADNDSGAPGANEVIVNLGYA